jgi:HTH-type transcriptional regulator / antitoxin HipB
MIRIMKTTKFKTYSLDEVTDEFIGKKGTPERDKFEFELKMDLIGEMIRETRKEMNLTQEQLGKLVGVQKAQISKIENNTKDVRFSTIMKVFDALKAKVKFTIEFDKNNQLSIA